MAAKTQTMDAYLSGLDSDKRQALQKLRKAIHAAVPNAEEGTSYGLPAFLVNGKAVAALSASKSLSRTNLSELGRLPRGNRTLQGGASSNGLAPVRRGSPSSRPMVASSKYL